ncbi:efflux RND transporter permease subunit [Aureimonas leprariae]|uniref:MMPL family transporter n=1 Tax=Plantimonas leprariae TaxID=2615207 RepID=A0A7V7PRP8_9HYPH|nr:efflux RND transporter permease subunit [Aureimonas leprariae]KAB0681417.1 MMPL family transporter [Aureimonas leprariae]
MTDRPPDQPDRRDESGSRDDERRIEAREASGERVQAGDGPPRETDVTAAVDEASDEGGRLSGPFIRYPIATSLLAVGLLLVGIVSFWFLPVAPLPQVDFPTIQVTGQLPGASPETMASSVAQPLETQFAQIEGVSEMTSQSTLGRTQITLQFELSRDVDAAANDVQAAINAAGGQLPDDLPTPPTYRKVNPADAPILILGATSDTMPIVELNDAIETKVSQQLSQVAGVGQVIVGGQQKPAVRVQLDPAKLYAKQMTVEDVRTALEGVTSNSAKGSIDGANRAFTIYSNDQLTEAEAWNGTIVTYRDLAPVRVKDIGRAILGPEDAKQAAWTDGKRGVFLIVFKQPNANVIDVVDSINEELPRLKEGLPPGIRLWSLSDRTTTIRASVEDVEFTLLITVGLVVAVIFVFLRTLWGTVIPSLTVPLALFGTCAGMLAFGYTLDNLSLMALTIAVGFVVDDAIVVLENIQRHIENGMKPMQAALKGAGEIGFTILSISLSLVAVLIPLLLMTGIIGRLFREFSVVLAMTILISAAVSLTLTPMMASRFLVPERPMAERGRLFRWSERGFEALVNGYMRGLDVVLRHRLATLLVFFATLGATVALFVMIPKGFFPQQDTGLIQGKVEAAQSISFAAMSARQEEVGRIVQADPDVASVAMRVGGSGGDAANVGSMYITLKPRDEREADADAIIRRLRDKFHGVMGVQVFLQAQQDVRIGGRQSRTQYQFTLTTPETAELNSSAPKVLDALKKLPELADVASDQQTSGTTLTLTIDRDQASRYGIRPDVIDATLNDAFGQRQIAQYFTQLNSYHVVMEVLPELQGDPETLDKLYVKAEGGALVPLSAFAKWTTVPVRPLLISHQSQFPSVTISFNLAPGVALGEATEAAEKAVADLKLPPAVQTKFSGSAQAFQSSLATMPLLILAALVAVYLILGILYESYIHPLTILSTLPSAGVGALATLMLFGYEFSLIALVALILLIGIVKKNGIMLVDFAIMLEGEGKPAEEAIREAARLRFRPIMMTTAAAMLGAVPLMIGGHTGSELRQPLGFAMVGGLIVSQALTLFTTPVIYLYLDRLQQRLGRRRAKAEPANEEKVGIAQPAE